MNKYIREDGVGLVEVLISMVVFMFAFVAVSGVQITNLTSVNGSSIHFAANQLSDEMLETLRAEASEARAGTFNHDGSGTDTVPVVLQSWVQRISGSIHDGQGSVNCTLDTCDVSISWPEELDGTSVRQFYRTRTSL